MSHTAIWIDHHKATIYNFTATGVKEKTIEASSAKKLDKEHQKKFYHDVALAVQNPEKIVLFGPGRAKDEFKHHCENHHHHQVLEAIVGVENMKDHPSKAEIIAKANSFFSNYFQWNSLTQ
jgi:stalled ribosome rescue protein Dom34